MAGLPTVDVYFDYVSNFSYYLAHRLGFAERYQGAVLDWKPIDLSALSSYEGGMPYTPSKRRYVVLDGIRSQAYYGIPTAVPKPFPMGDLETARRAALAAREAGVFPAYHAAAFRAAWRDQRDLSDEPVVADCLREAGGDADSLLERARAPEIASRARGLVEEAEARGVFGVPTLVLDDELFWGNDRLEMLAWRLARRAEDT